MMRLHFILCSLYANPFYFQDLSISIFYDFYHNYLKIFMISTSNRCLFSLTQTIYGHGFHNIDNNEHKNSSTMQRHLEC
jgi:hypothetical protein